jgi:ribosome-binding protein aMBF1 (putative translation factor)
MQKTRRSKSFRKRISSLQKGKKVGSEHHNSKLNDNEKKDIKEKYSKPGITYENLADEYNVSVSTIRRTLMS